MQHTYNFLPKKLGWERLKLILWNIDLLLEYKFRLRKGVWQSKFDKFLLEKMHITFAEENKKIK